MVRLPNARSDQLLRYAISDSALYPQLDPVLYLRLLLRTTADLVQWRASELPPPPQRRGLKEAADLARQAGKQLLVNSHLDLALSASLDGVHYKSTHAEDSPRAVAAGLLVGRSVHSIEEGRVACDLGCDYVLLSPIFEPRSKQSRLPPLGIEGIVAAVRTLPVPVFALGGIEECHWTELAGLGLAGLAGISWAHDELDSLLADPPSEAEEVRN